MSLARRVPETMTSIIARVRKEIGDPANDADGNAIAVTRWTDTTITEDANDHIIEMGVRLGLVSAGAGLIHTDATYTAMADEIDLPAGVGSGAIHAVEDITDPSYTRMLTYVSPSEIETIYRRSLTLFSQDRYYWTLGETAAGAYEIKLRPKPQQNISLRIRSFAPALVTGAPGDQPPLADIWVEYIALGAADRLLSRDDEVPPRLTARLLVQQEKFEQYARRRLGPTRVRRSRRASA